MWYNLTQSLIAQKVAIIIPLLSQLAKPHSLLLPITPICFAFVLFNLTENVDPAAYVPIGRYLICLREVVKVSFVWHLAYLIIVFINNFKQNLPNTFFSSSCVTTCREPLGSKGSGCPCCKTMRLRHFYIRVTHAP